MFADNYVGTTIDGTYSTTVDWKPSKQAAAVTFKVTQRYVPRCRSRKDDLPIVFHRNYISISHLFRDTATYWLKITLLECLLYGTSMIHHWTLK